MKGSDIYPVNKGACCGKNFSDEQVMAYYSDSTPTQGCLCVTKESIYGFNFVGFFRAFSTFDTFHAWPARLTNIHTKLKKKLFFYFFSSII